MVCTVPKILGIQSWFDTRFADICRAHDEAYTRRIWMWKLHADFRMAMKFCERGHCTLAIGSLLYNVTLGTVYWTWKGAKEKLKNKRGGNGQKGN